MKKVLHKREVITRLVYFLIIVLAVCRATQFHVNSGDNMDLARHMNMMRLIDRSGYSFSEYVFLHGDAFTSNITLKFSYFFNAIAYIICKYTTNYYVISWLFVFFDYSIIAYIGMDWWKNHNGRNKIQTIYEIMLCWSLFPFFQAVSGLRTSLASCIMAFAVYLFLYKEKNIFLFIIVSLFSASFHPIVLVAIPFALLAKYTNRKKGILISLLLSILVSITPRILIHSKGFFYAIAYKYLQYTSPEGYKATRFCYYGVIVVCLLVIIQYFFIFFLNRRIQHVYARNEKYILYDFIFYYMIFIMSNIGSYEMVVRPAYLLGALSSIISSMLLKKISFCNNKIKVVFNVILFVVLIYTSYMYCIWHSEFFV